jgi:hypothetical protein
MDKHLSLLCQLVKKFKNNQKQINMKKGILIGTILLIASISTSFANGKKDISSTVENSFKQEFANAKIIKLENYDEYVKLTFKSNDQVMFAYYTNNAELLAVSKNILSNQLPVNLLKNLKKNFAGYWITDLFEIKTNDETFYYAGLENSDNTLVLKADGNNFWQIDRLEKKASE